MINPWEVKDDDLSENINQLFRVIGVCKITDLTDSFLCKFSYTKQGLGCFTLAYSGCSLDNLLTPTDYHKTTLNDFNSLRNKMG